MVLNDIVRQLAQLNTTQKDRLNVERQRLDVERQRLGVEKDQLAILQKIEEELTPRSAVSLAFKLGTPVPQT